MQRPLGLQANVKERVIVSIASTVTPPFILPYSPEHWGKERDRHKGPALNAWNMGAFS